MPNKTPKKDPTAPSLAYQSLKARLDAWEMWEDLSPTEKLSQLLDTFSAESWSEPANLNVLAVFFHDAAQWMRIKARGKAIGVNVYDLERAVKDLLKRHTEAQHTAQNGAAAPSQNHQPNVITLSTVEGKPIEWLWWPYLALGEIAVLDGEPGVGKSLFSITLAAILSRGWPLPDQQGALTSPTGAPSTTLLMNAEDSLASTIRPRLDAAGADCTRVVALTGWHNAEDAPGEQRAFTLEHVPVLDNALREYRPKLVIIDPIQAYLGGKVDINRANETRPLLSMLGKCAERYHCAIVLVRHPAKGGQGRAIHRGLGSIDFIAAARTGLFVEQHPTNQGAAFICQTKTNIGPLGRTQTFTKDRGEFHWSGVSRLTAELLAGSGRGPDPYAFIAAVCWLEQRLEGGMAWASSDIEAEGEELDHAKRTLHRAKKALGIISTKMLDKWTWRLPSLSLLSPGSLDTLGSLDSLGLLGTLQPLQEDREDSGTESPVVVVDRQVNQVNQENQECQVSQVGIRASIGNVLINASQGDPPAEEEITL